MIGLKIAPNTSHTHIDEHDDGVVAVLEGDGAGVAALVILQLRVGARLQEEAADVNIALCLVDGIDTSSR
jgi:hypothetical protein